nr:immunity protein YezG family protein [Arthrobacter sp. zg-Y179]
MLLELRKLMYRPGCGTWFSLTMNLDNQGHLAANYNYDEEADWSFPLDDESYVEDQRIFPRNQEHIPAWLAPKLGLDGESN